MLHYKVSALECFLHNNNLQNPTNKQQKFLNNLYVYQKYDFYM